MTPRHPLAEPARGQDARSGLCGPPDRGIRSLNPPAVKTPARACAGRLTEASAQ
ncbi:hypothetical protein ACFSEO_11410 [Agromyces cerinus subsp. nitratus]|uniref:hypothetical protein n=1 Tax=Agromyces cerinus TaxID=33878 RepID=UPI003638DA8A